MERSDYLWNEVTIFWNEVTVRWNEVTWNEVTMERSDRIPGVYMRKLAPARVSHWDDFLISYRVYMMTGSFHILLFNGTFHVGKIHVWFKTMRSSLPAKSPRCHVNTPYSVSYM